MSAFSFFLFILLLFSINVSSKQCSAKDQARFIECRKYANEMQKKIRENPMNGKTFPPQSVFQDIVEHCNKTVTCMSNIDCKEASETLPTLKLSCRAIGFMGGPFATCFAKIKSQPPNKEKYPCAKDVVFDKINKDSKCNLFTTGKHCVEYVVKDICGEKAVDDFEKGALLMRTVLQCPS